MVVDSGWGGWAVCLAGWLVAAPQKRATISSNTQQHTLTTQQNVSAGVGTLLLLLLGVVVVVVVTSKSERESEDGREKRRGWMEERMQQGKMNGGRY